MRAHDWASKQPHIDAIIKTNISKPCSMFWQPFTTLFCSSREGKIVFIFCLFFFRQRPPWWRTKRRWWWGKEGSGRQLERAIRLPRSAESPCALHSILLQVRDLSLGYDSDETVLFKYCSGTCPRLASNHDLTLTNLLQSGVLQYTGHWHHQPCCRPTHHET